MDSSQGFETSANTPITMPRVERDGRFEEVCPREQEVREMGIPDAVPDYLLDGVDRDDIEALLEVGHKVFFASGESIFDTGDKADAMYVVLDGEAQVDVGGRFHRLTRGTVFGEMALVAPDRRMATVRATEPMHVLKVYAEDFRSLLLDRPQIALSMLRALALRLREVEQRIDAWMAS
jgi:CRP-like cAMP-binding protein